MHASMTQGLLVKHARMDSGPNVPKIHALPGWGGGLTLADYPAMSFIFVRLNPNANKLSWAIN